MTKWMRLRRTVLLLVLAGGVSVGGHVVTAHAEVAKELRGQLSRARSGIQAAEARLTSSTNYVPEEPGYVRVLEEAEKRLAKAEGFLEGLPADEPEVAELIARVKVVKAEIARRRAAAGQVAQAAAADTEALEAGLDVDLETLEAVRAQIVEFRRFYGDTLEIEGLELWPQIEKDGAALLAKYDGKRATSPEAQRMADKVRNLRHELKGGRDRASEYLTKFLPAKIEQYLGEAESLTSNSATNNVNVFVTGLLPLARAKVFLDKYEIMASWFPGTDTSLLAPGRARVARVEARVSAAKDMVAQRNVPPRDVYAGADREKLRGLIKEAWASRNPTFPSLKIVIHGSDWSRRTEWVRDRDRWRKIDQSYLEAMVFYKGSDKTAFGHTVIVIKDHLAGGALRFKMDGATAEPPTWNQVYLLGKL